MKKTKRTHEKSKHREIKNYKKFTRKKFMKLRKLNN